MAWWKRFDLSEIHEEFDAIAALGLDLVRVFLLWEDFQPDERRVSYRAVRDLERVLDAARDRGLAVLPVFFTGHTSGTNFMPAWLLGGSRRPDPRFRLVSNGRVVRGLLRDYYTDADLLDAQRLLLRAVIGDLRDHPAVFAWDLGSEHDRVLTPPSADAAGEWLRALADASRAADPAHPVTLGLHRENVEADRGVRVTDLAPLVDLVTMHGHAAEAEWARGPLDEAVAPFLAALAAALCGAPVLFSGLGLPTASPDERPRHVTARRLDHDVEAYLAGEDEGARYVEAVLRRLHDEGALGALAWGFADCDPSLWSSPPFDWAVHERSGGLVRGDLTPKRHAAVLRELAGLRPRVRPPRPMPELDRGEYYHAPREALRRQFAIYLGG